MPLQYKVPGYVGNGFLLLLGVVMIFQTGLTLGLLMGGLAALNLYLVYKLDMFCRPEQELQHELDMTKLREELAAAHKRLGDLEAGTSPPATDGLAPGAASSPPKSAP